MTSEQIEHLKSLAKKATPGPWTYDVGAGIIRAGCEGVFWEAGISPHDGTFLAACDPNTILALIEKIEFLEKTLRAEELLSQEWNTSYGEFGLR